MLLTPFEILKEAAEWKEFTKAKLKILKIRTLLNYFRELKSEQFFRQNKNKVHPKPTTCSFAWLK